MVQVVLLTIACADQTALGNDALRTYSYIKAVKRPPMFMRFASLATAITFAMPAVAQQSGTDELFELLMLPDIIEIMREEGVSYGDTIGQDLFAGPPTAEWAATVERIYDYEVMKGMVRADFETALEGEDLTPILEFFGSDQGQMIIGLEVSARRALLDDAVEEAAQDAAMIALADEDPRMMHVVAFVEANNLIETNVEGALNSNLAFFMGLLDGGAFAGALSEEQVLTDVWSQEAEIRDSTTEWINSFLFLAYQPLEDGDLQAYIAFSETDAGAVINRTMFDSFDRLFNGISRSLGRAAAKEMTMQEL
ncbi:hypothetical protein OCA8868_00319 [Octadecabacter ascidiaceicola]|uniref:Uncharacterized protein n=2 Tax=Octadecabacter ascidiaceicola TaxID=1655543 RepID=A0A238JNJ6_9RHOB|nr:hypothetical protein OCA8868_00319 [Octadecabacter ascidiaceicola]